MKNNPKIAKKNLAEFLNGTSQNQNWLTKIKSLPEITFHAIISFGIFQKRFDFVLFPNLT